MSMKDGIFSCFYCTDKKSAIFLVRRLYDLMTLNMCHAVFDFVGGLWGLTPPLVEDDPLTGDCKVWSGGSDSTPQQGKKYEFVIWRRLHSLCVQMHTTDHRRSQGAGGAVAPPRET